MDDRIDLSIVVPLLNEEGTIQELYERILENTGQYSMEVIFVDDGSTDSSLTILRNLASKDQRIKVIEFRRNFGKAAALQAAFDYCNGNIIITMDADLQDDPKEIPRFIQEINNGYDIVSGWKKKRHDPISKTLPSKLYNRVTSYFAGVKLHDFNCGFKAYRREAIKSIHIYGELHRYIPFLAHWKGFKVKELVVEHHPRTKGVSKYGFERYLRGLFDLLTVILITKYGNRPLHLFGTAGFITMTAGFLISLYLTVEKVIFGYALSDRPLLLLGVLLIITGFQVITIGLLAEYFMHSKRRKQEKHYIRTMENLTI